MDYIPMICDAALVIFFIVVIAVMAKRGFVKAIYKLVALAATIVAVAFLTQPVTEILAESQVGAIIYRNVNQTLTQTEQEKLQSGETETDATAIWDMPSYIKNSTEIRSIKNNMTSNASRAITDMLLRLLTAIILFVLIRLFLMLVFSLLDIVFKLPILSGLNKTVGFFTGFLNALVVVYVICAVISLNVGVFDGAKEIIEQTYIVKYFYDYNLLMNLFI